ncbi:MAG: hypothetical protein EZS28_009275 [Streblomastix strix]|uniref:Uncharacterized protein n=1 Tax=Streblomastix strix TaxID=222440 RepID=A0A5J4WKQ3_9EUKA|nr:MAG: hypothetical protein EZS28_009275 [Streblomastix strix]
MRQQIEIFGTAGGIEEENIADALCNVSCILDAYNKIKDADDSYVESKKRCLEQSIEEGGIEEIEAHIKHRKFAYPYQFVDPKYPKHTKEAIVNNWKDPTNNQ